MQTELCALLCVSRATRSCFLLWLNEQLARDITRQHERTPIPIQCRDSATLPLPALASLLGFQYTSSVQIPVPSERHQLDAALRDRLRRENPDIQRVINGCRVRLYAAHSALRGWGIFAAESIQCGEYVGEYTGELISSDEARRRHEFVYDRFRLNYVLVLREQTAGASVVRTNVDASRLGSYARLFNHSCAPTLRVEALRVDSFVPRLVFFARRDLETDEQLTFSYGRVSTSPSALDAVESSAMGDTAPAARVHGSVICHCQAQSCSGFMPFDASL